MNKVHDYRALEREYISTDISYRELCRRHCITAHSLVSVQAKKRGWEEKRQQYQARASDAYIEKHAARQADRVAEVQDDALELIIEGINKAREDMRATKLVRQPDGSITEEPALADEAEGRGAPHRPTPVPVRPTLEHQPAPGPHRHLGDVGRCPE